MKLTNNIFMPFMAILALLCVNVEAHPGGNGPNKQGRKAPAPTPIFIINKKGLEQREQDEKKDGKLCDEPSIPKFMQVGRHAKERMDERNISDLQIRNTILNGKCIPQYDGYKFTHNRMVIVVDKTKHKIITVYRNDEKKPKLKKTKKNEKKSEIGFGFPFAPSSEREIESEIKEGLRRYNSMKL